MLCLCPMMTDLAKAREWPEPWTDVSGVEGILWTGFAADRLTGFSRLQRGRAAGPCRQRVPAPSGSGVGGGLWQVTSFAGSRPVDRYVLTGMLAQAVGLERYTPCP